MKTITVSILAVAIGLAIAIAAVPGNNQVSGYPKKPVTLVVAYSPGGAVDNVARTVAKYIQPHLGQRVVVKNVPGAGGEIGYRSLAHSPNDGYTLGMITSPPILMLDKLRPGTGIQMSSFDAIASLQRDPVVLAVNADSPWMTLADFVAASHKSVLNVAGDGPNSNNQLQLAVATAMLGIDVNFVPYSGSGPSITSLLGNQVEAAVPSGSSATTYAQRGDLRVLAVFAPERYEYLPDAPTIFEASGVEVPAIGAAVRGVVAPVGIDEGRRKVLVDALDALYRDAEFLAHAEQTRLPLHFLGADDFEAYLDKTGMLLEEHMKLLNGSD